MADYFAAAHSAEIVLAGIVYEPDLPNKVRSSGDFTATHLKKSQNPELFR
ncbi:MAG TPA: hypothetical protein VKE42_01430 [Candidatus Cybelea sp.]|nr:hypothetical protein [Candidatus Cybelea sp.]